MNGGPTLLNVSAAGNTTIASGAAFVFNARSKITSPADGRLLLTDTAGSTFGRLQFGGVTSSFGAIVPSGNTLKFRLADDSNDTGITAGGIAFGGTKFTASGCGTVTSTAGGATAGEMLANVAGTCTITVTMGAGAPTPTNRWFCRAENETSSTNTMRSTGGTTTGCTFTGTTAIGDKIVFAGFGY